MTRATSKSDVITQLTGIADLPGARTPTAGLPAMVEQLIGQARAAKSGTARPDRPTAPLDSLTEEVAKITQLVRRLTARDPRK